MPASELGHFSSRFSTPNYGSCIIRAKWIDWLDKEQHLDGLFGTRDLSEIDHRLAWWLATMFSASNADELFLLIGRHGNRLNPTFWFKLVRKTALGSQDDPPLTKETFARWVSLLLSTAPATIDEASHTALSWMGEGCIQHSLMDSLLDVFDSMAAIRLRISPRISWFDDGTDDQQRPINVELPLAFDHFLLNKLWTEGLRPKLDQLAG